MLRCLDFASTNCVFVLVLCQFCTLVCALAQTPGAGVVTQEGTFTPARTRHWISTPRSPRQPHFTGSTLLCGHGDYFQCHRFTNRNIKAERSDLPVAAQRSTGEASENTGFWQPERWLSRFPGVLYHSTLSPRAPVCSSPYKAAHKELIW